MEESRKSNMYKIKLVIVDGNNQPINDDYITVDLLSLRLTYSCSGRSYTQHIYC